MTDSDRPRTVSADEALAIVRASESSGLPLATVSGELLRRMRKRKKATATGPMFEEGEPQA